MRIDGKCDCYIIQHQYKSDVNAPWYNPESDVNNPWYNSEDLSNFKKPLELREMVEPLMASGEVWQHYGIHGSYDYDNTIRIALEMSKLYPQYNWRVSRLIMTQSVFSCAEFKTT